MLNNFRNLTSLTRSLGAHWLMFRVSYALRMRTGLIRRQIPAYRWQDRPLETWLRKDIPSQREAYALWRRAHSPKFLFNTYRAERSDPQGSAVEARLPSNVPWNPHLAIAEAERVLNGELRYFAHQFVQTGFPPDWHRDPVSGAKVDGKKHWSEISNEGDVDIKFVWEASRFSLVYPLVRAYAFSRDERLAEAFWEGVQAWAESNPPNTGPNWMDGQEAALRLLAWTFGFYAFLDSPSTTSERIAQFTVLVAAHAERIHKNIDYAISTHSNHTISEAFGLWLVGILFPELKEAEKYLQSGRRLLEQEALAQIFPDGSYSMHSLNYHRFVLHIYFCALRLGELNKAPFSNALKDRVTLSVEYLSRLIDPVTGQMPVYGSNDGALVLPLNNCDFIDYRPLLQLGSYLTKRETLFDPGPWDEDLFWFYSEEFIAKRSKSAEEGKKLSDLRALRGESFPDGGIYLLRGENSQAVLRCADFRSRPSHADQLHMDLWWRGANLACDAGTYLYSGAGIWRNGLAHTSVHNTVTVDRQDQMKMVSRFIWTDWSKGTVLRHTKDLWQGEHDGYRRLPDPVTHRRSVLALEADRWLVVDQLAGKQSHHYSLHWLLGDFPYEQRENAILLSIDSTKYKVQFGLLEGNSIFSVLRGDPNSLRGWRSRYYGERQPAISVMLETDQPQACFWTYFGWETDGIERMGKLLTIRSNGWSQTIDLNELNT